MTHLADTRPIVSITTASTNPSVIGADLGYLLGRHPGLELASIRLIREDEGVHIVGRVGRLAEPECPSCRTVAGHPHTEYCQASAVCDDPAAHAPHIRYDAGPHTNCPGRRRCSCPGLGINPDCPRHNHDPDEDEPEQDEQAEQEAIAAADESAAAAEAEQQAYPS